MIWHLVAAIFAGLGSAGIALLLRALSRKKLPTWIIPVFAGAGMLGYQMYVEYTWFEHKQRQLPADAKVVTSETGQVFWRPWTLIYPMTTAFSVVDTGSVLRTELEGDRVLEFVEYRFENQPVEQVSYQRYLLNCTTADKLPLSPKGVPDIHRLQTLPAADPLLAILCGARP